MNNSNQKLFNRIRIFFRILYILVIILIVFIFLSQILNLTLLKDEQIGTLPILHVANNPDMTITMHGEEQKVEMIVSVGAIVMKGVSNGLKIANSLFLMISLFLYFFIVRNLRSIVTSLGKNEVFSLQNARLLRNIGLFLLLDLLLSYSIMIINTLTVNAIDPTSIGSLIGFVIGKAGGSIVAIIFTFFMAAVFRIGVNLQEENKSFV